MKYHGDFTSLSAFESWLTSHNISSGSPTDIQIGDRFSINGDAYDFFIAGIDTEYNKGATALTTHHITCIVNTGNHAMNSTNTTAGAYAGSVMNNTILPNKETQFSSIFGSHLLTRSTLLTNSVGSDGKSNNCSWFDKQLTLLSETQIYGAIQWGNVYDTGEGYEKLPIFNELTPLQLFGRAYIWLRGVASATGFCVAGSAGGPGSSGASTSFAAVALCCLG